MPLDLVSLGVGLLVVLTIGVAILGTWLLWRNGFVRGWHAARNQPPTCPECGYNLSGLTTCRCPECGKQYTLEKLWRSAVNLRRKNQLTAAPDPRSSKKPQAEEA